MPVYSRRLKQQKVRQSMSRKGNCLDKERTETLNMVLSLSGTAPKVVGVYAARLQQLEAI
jgi:transposase InsO family protein